MPCNITLWSFFRGLFRFVQPLSYSGAKGVGKEALKTGSHIITDILKKEPEQPVGDIFKTRFSEAKGNIEQRVIKMMGFGLGLKRKRQSKNSQSQGKHRKVKEIFTEEKKKTSSFNHSDHSFTISRVNVV